jgi:PIN domain nuclease of toxin-antitoxin system
MARGGAMILDTCALLWLASGSKKLSLSTLKQINGAAAVYVSAISGFEIALKSARGKLQLPDSPALWFEQIIAHHGLSVLPLDSNVCLTSARLPPIHDDPCDRFIIATAQINHLPVVTADERFAEYGLTVLC